MPITSEQIEHAYKCSKDVFEGRIEKNKAIDKLHTLHELNRGTAKDFINQYEWMLLGQGQRFKRTMSYASFDYYLNHIGSDNGLDALKIAIGAVKQNIEYYESTHGRMDGVRRLIESIEIGFGESTPTLNIFRPEHNISIKEINNAIFITDEKVTNGDINNYKLANTSFRNNLKFVEDFVDTCLNLGFTYALQHHHPLDHKRGDGNVGMQYISFGKKYGAGRDPFWDACIDERSPATFCIAKRHKNILRQEHIPFEQGKGGGHDLRVKPDHLKVALTAISSQAFNADVDVEIEKFAKEGHQPPIGNPKPHITEATVNVYTRDPEVKAWALYKANGKCECCGKPAPFKLPNGRLYLEVHHLIQLADGGADTINNCIAICPNCHRELHYGANRDKLVKDIKLKIEARKH